MSFRNTRIEFLFVFYTVFVFQVAPCVSKLPFVQLDLSQLRPGEFDCICGYATYPAIYGSVQAATARASYQALEAQFCGNFSTTHGPAKKDEVTRYQCYCGQKLDGDNFERLKHAVLESATKYKASKSYTTHSRKLECICGYLIFPGVYGSFEAAVTAATAAAVASSSDGKSPPNYHPPSGYKYLMSHYHLTDYQCYCSIPFNLGDTSELKAFTYADAIKYGVPQATIPPRESCSAPGKFECGCGYPLFPKTYRTLATAVTEQSDVANQDVAKSNHPSDDLTTYKLTDYQCFCTQSWYGGNFKKLNRETVAAARKYRVRETTESLTNG